MRPEVGNHVRERDGLPRADQLRVALGDVRAEPGPLRLTLGSREVKLPPGLLRSRCIRQVLVHRKPWPRTLFGAPRRCSPPRRADGRTISRRSMPSWSTWAGRIPRRRGGHTPSSVGSPARSGTSSAGGTSTITCADSESDGPLPWPSARAGDGSRPRLPERRRGPPTGTDVRRRRRRGTLAARRPDRGDRARGDDGPPGRALRVTRPDPNACIALNTFGLEGCSIHPSCGPYPIWLNAIYRARTDRIYYGNTKADAARTGFDDARVYRESSRPGADRAVPARVGSHGGVRLPVGVGRQDSEPIRIRQVEGVRDRRGVKRPLGAGLSGFRAGTRIKAYRRRNESLSPVDTKITTRDRRLRAIVRRRGAAPPAQRATGRRMGRVTPGPSGPAWSCRTGAAGGRARPASRRAPRPDAARSGGDTSSYRSRMKCSPDVVQMKVLLTFK